MIRAFSRWLFKRTHRAELRKCSAYARGPEPKTGLSGEAITPNHRIGMLDALLYLELLK